MPSTFRTTAYRFPNEILVLSLTIILFVSVIAFTVTATVCVSGIFILAVLILSYTSMQSQHQMLLQKAKLATDEAVPGMGIIISEAKNRLQVEPVDIFIAPSRVLNAYTFGLSSPKAIVLNSALFRVMDADEIQFILGHEMGHVALGHTWLNSLIGGMAGIPAPYGASYLLALIFRWWNRSCEFSADRAGLLACTYPAKAVRALVKLEAGSAAISPEALERILEKIQAEDDNPISSLLELTATHPMIIKRIEQIRKYSASPEYVRIQDLMNKNL